MKIIPVSFDSMGVRSMCTFVETSSKNVLIDPGASLGQERFGLPPNAIELKRLSELSKKINEIAEKADIITISHYHNDHYEPNSNFYSGKKIFIKHPKENICRSQKLEHAPFFVARLRNMTKELEFADGQEYSLDNTTLTFSPAVPHGKENSRFGFVNMVSIKDGKETVVHTSDVQGPLVESTADWIIEQNPNVLILGGPATFLLGFKLSETQLGDAMKNIQKILDNTKTEVILDHHAIREVDYMEHLKDIWDKKRVKTAAEYLNQENNLLEAKRKELWKDEIVL